MGRKGIILRKNAKREMGGRGERAKKVINWEKTREGGQVINIH